MFDYLEIKNKTYLITGVANKKSLAYFVGQMLLDLGAKIILSVQNEQLKDKVQKLFPHSPIVICDVEKENEMHLMADEIKKFGPLDGLLHSLAFAKFTPNQPAFHQTKSEDFLQASQISAFSLVQLSNALKDQFTTDASVVTISISSTKATSYGYLGPIKAMLEAQIPYLAKSFSVFSQVRFNAICSGPLKTAASAGIPNFMDNYLYAEQLTLRHKALSTKEVAKSVLFLLSNASSGINGSQIVVDAGMSCNYFDEKIVSHMSHQL